MKFVYLADNINRLNFGCRGTSTALRQLVEQNHEIVGTITGEFTHEDGSKDVFFDPLLPSSIYKRFHKLFRNKLVFKSWRKITRKINKGHKPSGYDFICEDPAESYKNLIKCLPANKHLSSFDLRRYDFDALIINGEGTMIMTTPPRRESLVFLMFINWALDLGKKVYFVNAMFSDCSVTGQNNKTLKTTNDLLKKCTFVSARDPYSLEYIKKYLPDVHAKFIPDALFTWKKYLNKDALNKNINYLLPYHREFDKSLQKIDLTKPYIIISGNSLVIRDIKKATADYCSLVNYLKEKMNIQIILLIVCSGDRFLQDVGAKTDTPCIPAEIPVLMGMNILANARLYISGRFHPSIMASLGGTPCVFQGSNSHKTESLQAMLGYEKTTVYSAFPDKKEFDSMLHEIKMKLELGEALREKINETTNKLSDGSKNLVRYLDGGFINE